MSAQRERCDPNQLALARAALIRGWHQGTRPTVEEILARFPSLAGAADAVADLLHVEAVLRQLCGQAVTLTELLSRFPQYGAAIEARCRSDADLGLPDTSRCVPDGPASQAVTLAPEDPYATLGADARPAAGDWPTVPGHEILKELGRGGMGVVYLARQVKLRRLVALKMILAGSAAGAAEMERFRLEAEALASLQHPHIVQIYEVGEVDVGTGTPCPYLALEFCGGGNLSGRLGQPLPARESAATVETLARAVSAAHEKGVVHRDLKPGNVLITEDGQLKITDFGLAKTSDQAQQLSRDNKTATGAILGTPNYMAPEQAGGKTSQVGPAVDVYALGAILYECLTGRPPFRGDTVFDTLLMVVEQEPVAPRQLNAKLPRDLETICLKCLRKNPAERYATAKELVEDLRRFLADEPIKARPPGLLQLADRWVRRHSGLILTWGAVLLLLSGLIWLFVYNPLLIPGLKGLSTPRILGAALPLALAVLAAAVRADGRAALLPAAVLGLGGFAWWRYSDPGGLDAHPALLAYLALALLPAVLAGVFWRRGWREALFWAAALAWPLLALSWKDYALVAMHGLLAGAFVWLARWSLRRESGPVALGAFVGVVAAAWVGETYSVRLHVAMRANGLRGWPVSLMTPYLEACFAFFGALVGALAASRLPQRSGGTQAVPSANTTRSTSDSNRSV
jgi:hypothetical protein